MNQYYKLAVVQLWTVFWPVYHVTCGSVLWNRTFLYIYLTTFFSVRNFKNTSALRVIFFSKMLKIESKFGKWKRNNLENIFRFWDNCIWKCYNKLPLLRREYLLSPVNGLTNSAKILHMTQRDFFNLNWLEREQ